MALNVGIIGLGAIGSYLAKKIDSDPRFNLIALSERSDDVYEKFKDELHSPPPNLSVDFFPSYTDIFIEAACVDAVDPVVREGLQRGKTVIVISIGGLVGNPPLSEFIKNTKGSLILPSGAVGGADILKSIPKEELNEVTLTTRKNPRSLPVEYKDIAEEKEIFYSNALEAVRKYPQNMNVAAFIALAGMGVEKTKVRIIADPDVKYNIHEISIKSDSGNYFIRCENYPFKNNPKSSRLAAYSIWAILESLDSNQRKGIY